MKERISAEIRKAITRHLVSHVQTKDDRDRIDILCDEASNEILILFDEYGDRLLRQCGIITGEDARRFEEAMKNPVKISDEELIRMKENYAQIMKNAKNVR